MKPDLAKKMFNVFHKVEALKKDKSNPFYKSYYTDINSILKVVKPILKSEKLFLSQPIIKNEVITVIIDYDTGEIFPERPEGIVLETSKPQERGSEITYYRRYGLLSLLGLEAEDDDANITVKRQINKPINNPNKFEL
tara:strand:+ start:778 stop:1191 length:414 start_codon:yes stop_codon:yes gene_type:complete